MNVSIKTKTSKGTVQTRWSNDQFNGVGWETVWTVPDPYLPIEKIEKVMKGAMSWEEAGRNHLAMCQNIKVKT